MLLSETNTTQQDCSNPIKSHGLDLTCQHTAAGCWMLLKAVGSVYGDVKRAHGLLHGSWIARIARTARSCTDLHGVARTARRARRARTAQTARTARTAGTLHGLHRLTTRTARTAGRTCPVDPLPTLLGLDATQETHLVLTGYFTLTSRKTVTVSCNTTFVCAAGSLEGVGYYSHTRHVYHQRNCTRSHAPSGAGR